MKILKLLNKTYLSILIIFFFSIVNSFSQDEPVDIWNIDKEQLEENSENKELISTAESEIETEKIDIRPELSGAVLHQFEKVNP